MKDTKEEDLPVTQNEPIFFPFRHHQTAQRKNETGTK